VKESIQHSHLRECLAGVLVVVACTAVALMLRPHLAAANLVMIYMVGVVLIAARFRRVAAVFTSVVSVATFDFFCVPPYLTLAVDDYEYLLTLAVMLGVALLISEMTTRIRLDAAAARAREKQTAALYDFSNRLASQSHAFEIVSTAAQLAENTFNARVTVFLPDHTGKISFSKRTSDRLFLPSTEQETAQKAFETGEKTTKHVAEIPGSEVLYLPIKGERQVLAVMAVLLESRRGALSADEQNLLNVFVRQTASAMDRSVAWSEAQSAGIRAETESMRTSLLSAVSHDLRTPLASITGAASTLHGHWERLDTKTRSELLASITAEADRLNRLLNNLLEVTRLERGVKIHKERFPLEEIVGSALHRLKAQIAGHRIVTDIPNDLPVVEIDPVLMEQVFINLIENGIKYTPEGNSIEIAARQGNQAVEVEVRDQGHGFAEGHEELVFDKFFRGKADKVRGSGLGLAICKAIVEAHGGSIRARNRSDGKGAILHFEIPIASVESNIVPKGRL
jgi:two-component system sensor histidine kinase KdpD